MPNIIIGFLFASGLMGIYIIELAWAFLIICVTVIGMFSGSCLYVVCFFFSRRNPSFAEVTPSGLRQW